MEYDELTREEYARRASAMIQRFEGYRATPYPDNDNMATIGYGYTFNRNNNVALFDQAGVQLSDRERQQLTAIDNAPANQKTALGLAFPVQITRDEARSLLETASLPNYEGPANRLNMPLSDERAALVSVTYNRGAGRVDTHMQGFTEAVADGDRAEAWYQLRYNSRGTNTDPDIELGIRSRRGMEAQAFGLYDDPQNVTSDEARGVYRMLQLHRDDIARNEREWGTGFDGTAQPLAHNAVATSNRNNPDLVQLFGEVPTINAALEPARNRLLTDLRTDHPDIADRLANNAFAADAIFMDPGRDLRTGAGLRVDQRNNTTQDVDPDHAATIDSQRMTRGNAPREVDSNDLLIGNGGDDTLRAHRGNDVLIGGAGRDRMEGGIGHDTYVANAGDTVMDSDGRGELRWRNERGRDELLNGGVRNEGDPANTYRSANGQFTYVVDGSNLTVSNGQGESLRVENYAAGDMGIRLQDAPTREGRATPDAPPAQETNAQAIERLSPQDRALFDQMRSAVQRNGGGFTQEQTENIAAAGVAEYRRRESVVREPQDIGVYGDRLFTSYFPNGPGREPNFQSNVRLEDAASVPARESVQQVEAQRQQGVATPVQEREQQLDGRVR
ncbi:MAG: hemolysin [Lysobacter sp.]|nr:hemolysin [Lysobacter sp.]